MILRIGWLAAALLAGFWLSATAPAASVTTLLADSPLIIKELEFNREMTALVVSGEKSIPLDSVIKIEFEHASSATATAKEGVELFTRGGDVLMAKLEGIEKETFVLKSPLVGSEPLRLASSDLIGMIFHERVAKLLDPARQASFLDEVRRTFANLPQDDIVFVKAGMLKGVIVELSETRIVFQRLDEDKKREFPIESVLAIHMHPFGQAATGFKGLYLAATDVDGNRVCGIPKKYEKGSVVLESNWGVTYYCDAARLVRLQTGNGRFTYLSDMKPAGVEYHEYFEEPDKGARIVRTLKPDQSNLSTPISLRGRLYEKGLGMYSLMSARYDVAGAGYTSLRSTIGIDDAAGDSTWRSVEFKVLADDKVIYTKLINGDEVELIDLKLPADAKTITLTADFGQFLQILDVADWAGAMLIK